MQCSPSSIRRSARVLPWLAGAALCLLAVVRLAPGAAEQAEQTAGTSGSAPRTAEAQCVNRTDSSSRSRSARRPLAVPADSAASDVTLCQALGPAAPHNTPYVDCVGGYCGEAPWDPARGAPWQTYAQGEYVGHFRTQHVPVYRLRPDDVLDFVYRLTRNETRRPYQLEVGDEIRVESLTDVNLDRESLIVQPDGTITLRLLGQVPATRRTVTQLRDELEKLYERYYKEPTITVTPVRVNTRLEDVRATVDARAGQGGQQRTSQVTPDGTLALPAVGNIFVQGMSLDELQLEVNARYKAVVEGLEVTPILVSRAPRSVYVLGEVGAPGRYVMEGPTTVLQAIALAGGWTTVGGNARQVVVLRRGDDWRLMATRLNLMLALLGQDPCPEGEIWMNDSDVVIVPKSALLVTDEYIELIFTRGLYSVFPFQGLSLNMAKASTL